MLIVYPLKIRTTITPGTPLIGSLVNAIRTAHVTIRNGDVVVISSKVVAISEGRIQQLTHMKPKSRAINIAKRYGMDPRFVQVILDQADKFIGGVKGALLTIIQGNATANAGIDQKNAPPGRIVLWPENPDRSAYRIHQALNNIFRKQIGVIIVDSRVTPLRLGTIGMAIGCSGINPLKDFRGRTDLYSKRIQITIQAVADGIAAAAQLLMGESGEKIPFVVVRGSNVLLSKRSLGMDKTKLSVGDCLYMSQLRNY